MPDIDPIDLELVAQTATPGVQAVGDTDALIAATTRIVELTTPFTAPRKLTLPSLANFGAQRLMIVDTAGVNGSNVLTLIPQPGETIQGAGFRLVEFAGFAIEIVATGSGWYIDAPVRPGADPNAAGYDIILIAGQSNAAGFTNAAGDSRYDYTDPRVDMWPCSGAYAGRIVLASEPIPTPQGAVGSLFLSAGLAMAKRYLLQRPPSRKILLINTAWGSTGFSDDRWRAGNPGSDLYENAIAQANAAIASGKNNRIAYIYWLQGEADAKAGVTQTQYAAYLDALIAGFRARITGAANAPFVMMGMSPEWLANTESATVANKAAIAAAHADTPRRVVRTSYTPGPTGVSNPAGNTVHYANAGQRLLAQYAIETGLPNALANRPDVLPKAPTLTAVSGVTASGFTVNWTAPTLTRVVSFLVEWRIAGQTAWSSASVPPTVTSYAVTDLAANSTCEYRVSSVNEAGSTATVIATQTAVNPPFSITSPLTANAISGVAFSYQITVIGPVISYTASDLPAWAMFNAATGLISGTPTAAGSLSFRIGAIGAGGLSANAAVALSIGANTSPAVAPVSRMKSTSVIAAGGTVSQATDVSGNSRHWTQPIAASQPVQAMRGPIPVLRFGPAKNLVNAGLSNPLGSYTKLLLFFQEASVAANAENYMSGLASATDCHLLWKNTQTKDSRLTRVGTHNNVNAGGAYAPKSVSAGLNKWIMLAVTYDASTNAMFTYENGVAGTGATVTAKPVTATVFLGGIDSAAPRNGAAMDVAEAAIWSSALTAAQIAAEKSRLETYYGITLS